MAATRKQHTQEFKHQAVRLVTEQGLSLAQAARDLGLNDNVLARWKKELTQQGEQSFPGSGRAQEDELVKLRREVEVLRREREILKKAVGIFSQPLRKVPVHPGAQEPVPGQGDVPGSGCHTQWLLRLEPETSESPQETR